jgi:hypothetical protein
MSKSFTLFALIALLALCVGFSAASQSSRARYSTERVYDFTVSAQKDQASWRAFGRQWTVQLYLSDVTEDNSDYFHGTLEGDENAVVSFALLPGTGLSGMIAERNQTWWIVARPVEETGNSIEEADLGVFMFREEHDSIPAGVLPPLSEPVSAEEEHTDDSADASDETVKRTLTSYKVAVFFDQKWALASNNPWSSQADTVGLFNDVNAIYKAAGLNTFTVVYGKQITNTESSISDMLSYFSTTASASISAFTDTSYTNYAWLVGTNVGGLAYVGTSCKGSKAKQTTKTGVMGLVNYSRLWTVKTIAHELGHNRGANHQFDNQCSGSTTTNCQCSLMSYCFPTAKNNPGGAVNAFTDFNINEMQAAGCY